VGWDSGKRLWEFSGDQLTVDHDNHYLNYQGHGMGKLYYKNKPYLTVYAPRLRFDLISKSAQAFEGVRLYAKPKTSLLAGELFWNQNSQQMFIPGKVRLRSPYGTFSGNHLLFIAYRGEVKMRQVTMAMRLKVTPEFGQLFRFKGDDE